MSELLACIIPGAIKPPGSRDSLLASQYHCYPQLRRLDGPK